MAVLYIVGIIACIAGSYFFSSSEMSYSSCNELRLQNSEDKRAKKALYIIRHFDEALSTILIGNNLVNIASSSLTSVLILVLMGNDGLAWIGTIVVTILIIIFGETIPKIISKKKPNTLALAYAPFIRALMTIFFPLVWVVVKLVALITGKAKEEEPDDEEQVEEFQSIIETAEDEGIIDEDQSELLQNAIDFADTSASEVMTARVDVDAIDIDDSIEDILEQASHTRYTRLPVYEDSIDNIIGTLHLNNFYQLCCRLMDGVNGDAAGNSGSGQQDGSERRIRNIFEDAYSADDDRHIKERITKDMFRSILSQPCFVYKTAKLPEVLDTLRKERQHLAIVTDEYGGTDGVITMEDVLEEIVGEIWDENDVVEKDAVRVGANELRIDGDMNLYDFFELIGEDEDIAEEYESDTAGGWAIEMLEHYPKVGETFEWEKKPIDNGDEPETVIRFTVLEVGDHRVEKLLAEMD